MGQWDSGTRQDSMCPTVGQSKQVQSIDIHTITVICPCPT
nr:MAG TPA: hypothetical protein [Caudoviricetes sp.]